MADPKVSAAGKAAPEAAAADAAADAPQAAAETKTPPASKGLLSTRNGVTFLLFLCIAISFTQRVNLSVAIVAITDPTINPNFPTYDLKGQKDTVLSSFFWGCVVTQVPGGMLVQRVGGKPLLLLAMSVSSVLGLLTPLAASLGWGALCAARVLQGLAQGLLFPSIHSLLAKWAPPVERGRLSSYVYAGIQLGTIVAMSVTGALCASSAGWPSAFYIFGALGVAWTAAWVVAGANSPAAHRWCSPEERAYIEGALGSTSSAARPPTPWGSILTSLPMWSLIVVHCGQNWGFTTLLTEIPSYMSDVLQYDLKDNGMLSALPYLVMWLLSFVFSFASEEVTGREILSLTASRKLFNTIGQWGPAMALLGVAFVESSAAAVALLTVAVGLYAAIYVGFLVNHIDLSPNFAAPMIGVTSCAGTLMSILGPMTVGFVVSEEGTREEWQVVFFVAAGFCFVGNLTFVLLGSAEVQPWNTPKDNFDAEKEENATEKEKH